MKNSRADFRRLLNKEDAESRNPISHKHGSYRQIKRLYGDYLYNQDREKFEVNYQEWITTLSNNHLT